MGAAKKPPFKGFFMGIYKIKVENGFKIDGMRVIKGENYTILIRKWGKKYTELLGTDLTK